MRSYENDKPIKVPRLYMSLSKKTLSRLCNISFVIAKIFPRKTRKDIDVGKDVVVGNTKFYL